MKDIVIFGAGGMGKDIQWLIERINKISDTWNILGYVDDGKVVGEIVDDYPVLGGINYLKKTNTPMNVVCSVANSRIRKNVTEQLKDNPNIIFPNLIDPSVIMSERVEMGEGNVICAGCIVSVDINLGNFNIFCVDTTLGHDSCIGSYVTLYPSVNVSGNIIIKDMVEVGTGANLIQGLNIGNGSIIGAGTVLIKNVEPYCTMVGNPARKVK